MEGLLDFYLLIPYYNNLSGLRRSLESVNYNPSSYAVLIVDDGSQHPLTQEDLAGILPTEVSLNILHLDENKGITHALNTGLQWLGTNKARYVARLDCGDLCIPERFNKQVAFLDKDPDIDMVGSWCIFKDFSSGFSYRYDTPVAEKKIRRSMHFRNIFIHPTVMWRSEIVLRTGNYPEIYPHAEDYGFFYEIINKGRAAIIPEHLVLCEINPKGISLFFRQQQLISRIKVVRQYGSKGILSLTGILKLRIMLLIPYKYILAIKKRVYSI
jgi:glycosyltransferase involved in cell wall biosynthesis